MRMWGAFVAVVLAVGPAVGVADAADDPPLSVPAEELAAALECVEPATPDPAKEPVLLVHGTGVTPEENWSFNYRAVLPEQGWTTCTVRLPDRALGDIQVASEYVVAAVRTMAARAGGPVDVLGHSQGGLEPRWAVRWWPGIRSLVDDLVTLAAPHHGTVVADGGCANGCAPAIQQMRPGSKFLAALNEGDETPGDISYTSVGTRTDQLVQPVESTALAGGATSIILQDLCPGRPVDHVGIVTDAPTFALVVDAFTSPGPADVARFDAAQCADVSFVPPGAGLQGGLEGLRTTDPFDPSLFAPGEEPPLAGYTGAGAAGSTTTTTAAAAAGPAAAAAPTPVAATELPRTGGGLSPLTQVLAGCALLLGVALWPGRRRRRRS